jgi:hypothetical protein
MLPAVQSSRSDVTGTQQSHEALALLSYMKLPLITFKKKLSWDSKLMLYKAISQMLRCISNKVYFILLSH